MKKPLRNWAMALIAVLGVTLLGAVLLVSPGPSASMKETKLFCQGIGTNTSLPEVMQSASESPRGPIKADMVDGKVLIRLHTCHCWVSFLPAGTDVSEVVCNS